jgi:RNA polymerase sigma-70 factor (ECF subfamily)
MGDEIDWNARLIDVARKRDKQAFAELFRHFGPRLKSYLLRFGTPAGMAEELVQETMLTVWRRAESFNPAVAGAGAWIYTIARNLRIDQVRREKTAARFGFDPSDEPEPPPETGVLILAQERTDRIREALGALSAEQARIVEMSFFSDKPHTEIARDLGIPLGTVKSRVRLALGRLRALLGDMAGDEK